MSQVLVPHLPPMNPVDKTELSLLLTTVRENIILKELWYCLRGEEQDQNLFRIWKFALN